MLIAANAAVVCITTAEGSARQLFTTYPVWVLLLQQFQQYSGI
jgi:hypothetical protein